VYYCGFSQYKNLFFASIMSTKIIVELCQNHAGNRETLKKMIQAAAKNGADYVKIQTIFSEDLTKRERFENGSQDASGKTLVIKRPHQSEVDRLSKLDLDLEDYEWFVEECGRNGVIPITTIFSRHRIPAMAKISWPGRVVKVASYDCASYPMLKELADHFDEFIISTGATYDEEIEKTAELMKGLGKKFHFLHCVTSYPNTLDMTNLERMKWLRRFTDKVGWSDHTLVERDNILASKVAIMLGADFIERHFTILDRDKTKDGPISINPELLKELDEFRKKTNDEQLAHLEKDFPEWKTLLGKPRREMTQTELLNRDYYRGRFASPVDGGWKYNWED